MLQFLCVCVNTEEEGHDIFKCMCYTLNPIAKIPFPFLATLQHHHLFFLAWDVSHIHTPESFFLEFPSKESQQAILPFQAPNFE